MTASPRYISPALLSSALLAISCISHAAAPPTVVIGNHLPFSHNGLTFVVDQRAAFLVDIGWRFYQGVKTPWVPGTTAPDHSYHQSSFTQDGATVTYQWARAGDGAIAQLDTDQPVTLTITLGPTWPRLKSNYQATPDGATGTGDDGKIRWHLHLSQAPLESKGGGEKLELLVALKPGAPLRFSAGLDGAPPLPAFTAMDALLKSAAAQYAARRPAASGPWGDFVSPIADNLNNTIVYSSLYESPENRLAHTVSRTWAKGPDRSPYFCWDSFFNGLLACLDDPMAGRATIRAILSAQQPAGFIPNVANFNFDGGLVTSADRSQHPVGAMCVWKIHQRWPDPRFLAEVYPKLLKWHRWWPTARDGNRDGLLEWGSATGKFQNALYECWDDTLAFDGVKMIGPHMNANAVDLNSLWATDAEFLALIADVLEKPEDAVALRAGRETMLKNINANLWNEEMGVYCSRFWDDDGKPGKFLTRLTPMNFYPLIAGAPDPARAQRVLAVLTDPKKFWGEWLLPTLAYDDPDWHQQQYWRGKVWAPVNYLVFQGLKRYASPAIQNEFASRSIKLFMKNWNAEGICAENYFSTTGKWGSDPHYTWGALLALIGVEALVDIDNHGHIVTGSGLPDGITLRRIPIMGRPVSGSTRNGSFTLDLPPQIEAGSKPSIFMKGFSWGFPGLRGDFKNPESITSLKQLRATGTEWIAIPFCALMDNESSPEIRWGAACKTMVTDEEIRHAVDVAHRLGFKVLLKPVVDPENGQWRGRIKFDSPEKWNLFLDNYQKFMLYYARIAAETKCEMFNLGCEMNTLVKYEKQWRELAAKTRKIYQGVITYNANHDALDSVKWWDAVDIISVSAYYPVGKGADSTVEEMMDSWKPVRTHMASVAQKYNKQLFFIEIGMMSTRGSSRTPAKWETGGQPYDGEEQARYYDAAFRAFSDQPWFAGYFWWKWDAVLSRPETSSMNTKRATIVGKQGFRITGKAAEAVVREWYAKPAHQ